MSEMKEYKMRDFIYNNGLVNAFMLLQGDEISEEIDDFTIVWKGIKVELRDNSLVFHTDESNLFELYKFLMGKYYQESIEYTGNERLYVSEDLSDVIVGNKVGPKIFAARSIRPKDTQREIGVVSVEPDVFLTLLEKYHNKEKEGYFEKIKNKKDRKFWYGNKDENDLKMQANNGEKINVLMYVSLENIKKTLHSKIASVKKSSDSCVVCGSNYTILMMKMNGKLIEKHFSINSMNVIYDFGTSPPVNRDHRLDYKPPLCYMCDIFYRLGMLNNYFYINKMFVFDSSSLRILKVIKERLGIGNEYVPQENEKIKTNITGKIPIPISKDFSSILGVIIHTYEKTKNYENILYNLSNSTMVKFDIDSTKVDRSYFYNRLSKMFVLLRKIEDSDLGMSADSFFNHLMYYVYYSKRDNKEYPSVYENLCASILNFQPIEHHIFEAGYAHLSKGGSNLRNYMDIATFLKIYQKVRGDENMKYEEIVDKCSLLGARIGTYAAQVEEKNLVYQIREIGNFEKLVEFFRDLEYSVLKNGRGDMWNAKVDENSDVRYNDLVGDIIKLAEDKKHISLIRDVLGIFAVQSYLATEYAKNKGGA